MQEHYNKLLTYAYNIVGSYEDARDVVQDVLEKYITLDKSNIRHESNFLIKSTVNHAINFKTRQSKKEVFGEWLPEPVSFENADTKLIRDETASYTMLVLFEHLSPKERAVFILKEAFNYSHAEIAELLEINTENSRQLLSRANKQLKGGKFSPHNPYSGIHIEILEKYQVALAEANIQELEHLLVSDIKLNADGGTKVQVIKGTEMGKTATATLLVYVQQQFLLDKEFTFQFFNHQPAICFWDNDKLHNCQILQLNNSGLIQEIYSIVDPEKLKNLIRLSHL
ncbi:sigma-70 family RNA polymerase sigma factor [Sphingobacterium sp. SGR-19]|uniref:sigma-70 family RNA polymerase sigma factor n=1 Tax=Sphingobacterium sp. SGR-19 TaxID=2710886 RepID=UPI0013EAA0C7|nr:sigma-70 family RNA polymerase sigma factor [Sphingobacterium sp. SGR-19]NGM66878.1 sigma-70 family RNA polymerase sigma factor [Sphingobacterium sp. SGR-19]